MLGVRYLGLLFTLLLVILSGSAAAAAEKTAQADKAEAAKEASRVFEVDANAQGPAERSPEDHAQAVARMQSAATAETAREAVEIATEEILELIRAGQNYAKDDPDRFYAEVEELLRPVVDFPRFARSVMAPSARAASRSHAGGRGPL